MSQHWRAQRERGSRGAIRLIIWLALHCGRTVCRGLLVPISVYFFLAAPLARRSSREFLQRALERPATWRDTLRHLFVFATTLLDRVYLVNGRHRDFSVSLVNEQAFDRALAQGRGCILLGSHLGSFEMLGIVGSLEKRLAINVVMHIDDSAHLRDLVLQSGNRFPYQVITLGRPGSMLQVRECLERGEIVGVLADRVYGNEPTQSVPFLGRPARFSMSPMRLAAITGAPTLMVFGVFRGGSRYEIAFEPLAQPQAAGATPSAPLAPAQSLVRYVETLERFARRFPCNWFNFYDYWST